MPTRTLTSKPTAAPTATRTIVKSPAPKATIKKASPVATRTLKPAASGIPTATRTVARSTKPATPVATRTLAGKPTPTPKATTKPTTKATPTAKAATTAPAIPASTSSKTAPHAAHVTLCVQVTQTQASSQRGQAAQWTVSAWTTGGNLPDAILRLRSAPASAGVPKFSFGCGKDDGTSSCDLGAVDAKSAPRQLQAQLAVPVTAAKVTSVSLTVTGSAAHLAKDPKAAAAVSITAPAAATAGQQAGDGLTAPVPVIVVSPLPVSSLPGIPDLSPTLSASGGNASDLFPTLAPKPTASPSRPASRPRTTPVADTSALPEGAPVIGAQIAGLAALALALILAVTRLSIRRRPKTSTDKTAASPATGEGPATEPESEPPSAAEDNPAKGGDN